MPARMLRLLPILAWTLPLGILVQAALAGQAWFLSPRLFGLHGGIGHGVLLLSVVTAVLAWTWKPVRGVAILATIAVVGLIGQTGLGYAGRRSGVAVASSVHIPLGVALLGLTVAVALLATIRVAAAER